MPAALQHAVWSVGQQVARAHFVQRSREQFPQLAVRRRRPRAPARDLRQLVEKRIRLHPHGVHDDAGAAGGVDRGLFGQPAGGVVSIREDEHQRTRRVVRLQLQREMDGVAQGRRAAAGHGAQGDADRRHVGGHRHAQIDDVREGDERGAIARMQRQGDPLAGLHQVLEPFAGDALAGVEHQRDAERQVLQRDAFHVLGHAVVGEREVMRGQAGDRRTAAGHRHIELDHFNAAAKRRLRRRDGLRGEQRRHEHSHHGVRASARSQVRDSRSNPIRKSIHGSSSVLCSCTATVASSRARSWWPSAISTRLNAAYGV